MPKAEFDIGFYIPNSPLNRIVMKLSEQAVSAIARALINDHNALSKSLAFWTAPGRAKRLSGRHVEAIARDLRENADALIQLADSIAPLAQATRRLRIHHQTRLDKSDRNRTRPSTQAEISRSIPSLTITSCCS